MIFSASLARCGDGRRESLASLDGNGTSSKGKGEKDLSQITTSEDLLLLLLPREQYIGVSQSEKLNVHNHIFTSSHWISFSFLFHFASLLQNRKKFFFNFHTNFGFLWAVFQSSSDKNCGIFPRSDAVTTAQL